MALHLFGKGFGSGDDAEAEEDAKTLDIPIHVFDLIIADECHRGYTLQDQQVWRETLDHFDAVKLGLTATPAKHTTAIFGAPVFTYGMQQVIDEDYLVDFDQVNIDSEVRLQGVPVKEGEQIVSVDRETGEQVVTKSLSVNNLAFCGLRSDTDLAGVLWRDSGEVCVPGRYPMRSGNGWRR